MKRVEFKLTMPGRNTWNGKWTGDEKNYTLVRTISDEECVPLFPGLNPVRSWSYSWSDGWRASITARIVQKGERLKKSDGFCGYEWMVASIMQHGRIYANHERPAEVSQ